MTAQDYPIGYTAVPRVGQHRSREGVVTSQRVVARRSGMKRVYTVRFPDGTTADFVASSIRVYKP